MIPKLVHFIFCVINFYILTFVYASCQNTVQTDSTSTQYPAIEKGLSINFPEDHGPHAEYRTEWWYLTANLWDESGNPLGIQWTLFRAALEPKTEKSKWSSSQIWMGHAALTSKNLHLVEEKIARDDVLQAGVVTEPFKAWIDDWRLEGADWDLLTVSASGKNFKYELELKATGPIIKHGDDGRSVKSALGQASAYYSQPFFSVKGWVEQNGQKQFVTGSAWADHEWSSQFLADTQEGWDWFSLNFDTGEKLMLFQVREKNNNHFYSGTWISKEGNKQSLDPSQILMSPSTEQSTSGYHTSWTIKIENLSVDIKIHAINSLSLMETIYPYWEGPILIHGSHNGYGYLEMTGYSD